MLTRMSFTWIINRKQLLSVNKEAEVDWIKIAHTAFSIIDKWAFLNDMISLIQSKHKYLHSGEFLLDLWAMILK